MLAGLIRPDRCETCRFPDDATRYGCRAALLAGFDQLLHFTERPVVRQCTGPSAALCDSPFKIGQVAEAPIASGSVEQIQRVSDAVPGITRKRSGQLDRSAAGWRSVAVVLAHDLLVTP